MKQGRLLELQGARHEIFMERPEIQAQVWAAVDAFLPARTARLTETGK
jgi:lysophospholipase